MTNGHVEAQPGSLFTVQTADGPRELDIYSPEGFAALANLWTRSGWQQMISYEVTWLGIPIIQLPEDIVMIQELIWRIRPSIVLECGVAHGGALVLYASLLELLGRGRAIGVDVEIRKYNRLAIESHPVSSRITLIEGSSIERDTFDQVTSLIGPTDKVMVMLDSNHTRDHVLAELNLYAPLVTPDSYLIVFDEVMPMVADAPNGKPDWEMDNPLEAVRSFLESHPEFVADPAYERLAVTYCRGGFLRRRVD
jgi:cephalosporin hydroxylase